MSFKLLLCLCVVFVFIILYFTKDTIRLPLWKSAVIFLFASASGIVGLKIMRWIEEGVWVGKSFFGAYYFGPIGVVHACLLLRTSLDEIEDMLDVSAPCLCASLAVMKIQCKINGCCQGIVLKTLEDGSLVRFPSQIVECVTALILLIYLLYLIRKGNRRGTVYFRFLIIYGALRFGLNLLRETTPWIWGLSAGCFWALLSFLLGWLFLYLRTLRLEAVSDRMNSKNKNAHHKNH